MRRLTRPQWREDKAVKQPSGAGGNRHRREKRNGQRQLEQQYRLQRGVGAKHKHGAMGEIDDVENSEDQRKTESEERVDAT